MVGGHYGEHHLHGYLGLYLIAKAGNKDSVSSILLIIWEINLLIIENYFYTGVTKKASAYISAEEAPLRKVNFFI